MARRPRIIQSSDDEDSSGPQQPKPRASGQEGSGTSRVYRASKAKASAAWQDCVPKKRNPATKDKADKSEKSVAKPAVKATRTYHKHRAPDMALDSDEDDHGDHDTTHAGISPHKRNLDRKRAIGVAVGKAELKPDKTSMRTSGASTKERKRAASEDEEETDEDSGDQADDDPSEDSSSDSGLEELEKKGTDALEALFDAEAPTWVDQDQEIESNTEDNDNPEPREHNHIRDHKTPRSRDDSKPHSRRAPSSPRNVSLDRDRDSLAVSRAKCSQSPSDVEDNSLVPPTKKKANAVARSSNNDAEDEDPPKAEKKKKSQRGANTTKEKEDDGRRKQRRGGAGKQRAEQKPSAKAANGRTREASAGKVVSCTVKRKYNEDILWADSAHNTDDQLEERTSLKRMRKARSNIEDAENSERDSDVDSEDDHIDLVIDPSKQHLSLKEQRPRVQKVATHAIRKLEAHLCLVHGFPELGADGVAFIRRALANSAKEIGDSEMRKILKNEKQLSYAKKMGSIPLQRLSLFRGKIKKTTDNMVRSFFGLTPDDVDKVRLLQDGIGYIYPFNRTNNTFQGDAAYSPSIFEEVLQAQFFSKPRSFGWSIVDRFASSLPDKPDEKEIPAAMLALVSTAIFASIDDYRSSRFAVGEFKTNIFLDTYKQNMEVLTSIKSGAPLAYHDIMHGLFMHVTGSERMGQGPAKNYLDVAAMARRSVAA